MITKQNPAQQLLFSKFDTVLSKSARRILDMGWQGVFRRVILQLLPIDKLESEFSKTMGRPSKDLYSVCGLLLIMEFFGWSLSETAMHYMCDLSIQYALNIETEAAVLGERTLVRYLKYMRKKTFMQEAMDIVAETLIRELNIDIRKQRLDSTHIFSNMAAWSRKQLFFNIVHRFLKQVRRKECELYQKIDLELRNRYEHNNGWIFGETSPMKLQRRGKVYTTEEQMGYDMRKLIEQFRENSDINNMTTYKNLVRVFSEQFVDNDGKAELVKHPGGKILLNPSDPEAEIGHKGVGYQVQISETCSENNAVQIITAAIPQGGSQSDMESLPEVEEKLKQADLLPQDWYADGGYGSDGNFTFSEANGVNLIAPAPPQPAGKVGLDECKFDDNNRIIECPAGNKPILTGFKKGKGRAVFFKGVCNQCPLKDKCRSQKSGKQNRQFKYAMPDLRSMKRRKKEATEEFKKDYGSKRCPIEGLNGRLKQFTPLRRLRVRGRKAVYHSIYAILTMRNIMQAARHGKIQAKKAAA